MQHLPRTCQGTLPKMATSSRLQLNKHTKTNLSPVFQLRYSFPRRLHLSSTYIPQDQNERSAEAEAKDREWRILFERKKMERSFGEKVVIEVKSIVGIPRPPDKYVIDRNSVRYEDLP